jgi:hypothetical protein
MSKCSRVLALLRNFFADSTMTGAENGESVAVELRFAKTMSDTDHEWVFSVNPETMGVFSEQMIQGGETYRHFEIPEFIEEELKQMGYTLVE